MINQSILFICGHLDIGGAGKILKFVANNCLDHYSCVSILCCSQEAYSPSINPQIHLYSTTIPSRITIISRLQTMREIRSIVKKLSPSIICAFTSEVSVMGRLATLGLKSLYVSAERGDPYTLPYIWKILTHFSYSCSDACIFQLPKARDYYGKIVLKKSYVIPNPFILPYNVTPYAGLRNKTIVSAGRFQPEKGFDTLIEAFAKVVSRHPDYSLIIYGEGPLIKDYQKQIEALGITGKVSFPGYVQNVAESVRKEGMFVLSSLLEGIPNVLIEAMSVGIPVVSTDCSPGGPAFLTDNGRRGLIVPMNDSKAMSNAIMELIENKELYEKLEKEEPKIREILDEAVISEKWINTFSEIINK